MCTHACWLLKGVETGDYETHCYSYITVVSTKL